MTWTETQPSVSNRLSRNRKWHDVIHSNLIVRTVGCKFPCPAAALRLSRLAAWWRYTVKRTLVSRSNVIAPLSVIKTASFRFTVISILDPVLIRRHQMVPYLLLEATWARMSANVMGEAVLLCCCDFEHWYNMMESATNIRRPEQCGTKFHAVWTVP